MMKMISSKRCIIGEGPIWNEKEGALYYTNGFGKEVCKYHFDTESLEILSFQKDCAAIAFDASNRMIVSQSDGVFLFERNGNRTPLYNTNQYKIQYANDMKVGPDGCIYVGTQSSKRVGAGDAVDGKLYRIDQHGGVKVLLDNMRLSNGMEWSLDEKYFYHTDSDTGIVKEYAFDIQKGDILFTGRQSAVPGLDGFTIGKDNRLYLACWGKGHVAVLDLQSMMVTEQIELPCSAPASCCFAGNEMNQLVVTTASLQADLEKEPYAGFTFLIDGIGGRKPYLFGRNEGKNGRYM